MFFDDTCCPQAAASATRPATYTQLRKDRILRRQFVRFLQSYSPPDKEAFT